MGTTREISSSICSVAVKVEPLGIHGLGYLAQRPPVGHRLGVANFQHLAQGLDAPLQVGEGALLLCKRGRGQDHVGGLGHLREEGVLHNQEVQLRCRLHRVSKLAVGEVGAVAHDHHGLHAPVRGSLKDLVDSQAGT